MKKLLIIIAAILIVFFLFSFSLYRLRMFYAKPLGGASTTQLQPL